MTAHRTAPDDEGRYVYLLAPDRRALVLIGPASKSAPSAVVAPADRVPLAQAVAGDEYVVVKRAVIDRVRAHCQFVTEAGAATMYQGGAYDVATEVLTALDGER